VTADSNSRRFRIEPPAPGAMTEVDIDGVPVAIANVEGALYAFESTCTHNQCSLTEGRLAGLTVVCACHGGTFDLRTGEVLAGPPDEPIRIRSVQQAGEELVVGV